MSTAISSRYADVRDGGCVRFSSEEYSEVDVLIEASQIPALVIWLQSVQLAPFKPDPEPDPRGVLYPALDMPKPLTPEEMRKLEVVREMMDNDRKRQRACPEAFKPPTPEEIQKLRQVENRRK